MNQIPADLINPALLDAPCAGRPGLFDDTEQHEPAEHFRQRAAEAVAVCNACPLHDTCRRISLELKPRDRSGIWAGTYWQHNHRSPKNLKIKEIS